jgi:hypothetical protein
VNHPVVYAILFRIRSCTKITEEWDGMRALRVLHVDQWIFIADPFTIINIRKYARLLVQHISLSSAHNSVLCNFFTPFIEYADIICMSVMYVCPVREREVRLDPLLRILKNKNGPTLALIV